MDTKVIDLLVKHDEDPTWYGVREFQGDRILCYIGSIDNTFEIYMFDVREIKTRKEVEND